MSKQKIFNKVSLPLPDGVIALINKHQKLIIYTVIGGGAVILDVGLFWVFNELAEMGVIISNTLSIFTAMLYSFLLNAFFNFRTRDKLLQRFAGFVAVTACGYVISTALLWMFSERMGLNGTLIKTLSLPVILLIQFSLNSRFTFQQKKDKEDQLLESIN